MDKLTLLKLGLNDKEIEIYLHLIGSGVQTVKQISDATTVNRTTVYRCMDSLRKQGLVEWIVDEKGNKAKATQLENLEILLNQKRQRINELKSSLSELISQLQLIKPVEKFSTQIRYYKGQKGVEQMIWNTLRTERTMRSFTSLGRREFIDSAFEDTFEKEWAQRGLKDQVITNENRLTYIKNRMVPAYRNTLDIRIVPKKKFYITSDIAIYNNIVTIMSLVKNELVGVEIENAEVAKTQKSIFDLGWETAMPLDFIYRRGED